jgi:Ca2+-binding EF-hand superfamily protein
MLPFILPLLDCYVNFEDYMNIKKKIYEQDGEILTEEKRQLEENRFYLIDKDKSGTITWSEFVEFEAANLLARKNKVLLP